VVLIVFLKGRKEVSKLSYQMKKRHLKNSKKYTCG